MPGTGFDPKQDRTQAEDSDLHRIGARYREIRPGIGQFLFGSDIMKILHVLNSRIYSGAEKVVCQIIHMFATDPGMEMVYCSPYSDNVRDMLKQENVSYLPVSKLVPGQLRRVIREQKPDVIHAHDMRASFICALCCGSIPLISHIHNNAYNSRGLSPKSVAYLLAGWKARHIFWVSRSSFEGYFFHRLFQGKSSVLFNIIDLNQVFQKRDQDAQDYSYDAIYIGRLTYQKNPQRLIELCALARERKPDFHLAVVGTGELEPEVKALTAQLGLEANVSFLGFQSNPMKMLSDSKCMILPSRWEGTPMCALEAMALGVPVVSTPTDGLLDLLDEGENGFLSDDDAVLAEKMVLLASDPVLREKLSANAAEKASGINDIQTYKNALSSWY